MDSEVSGTSSTGTQTDSTEAQTEQREVETEAQTDPVKYCRLKIVLTCLRIC